VSDLVLASDADRERTVAQLREHAAAGRLTLEEFTERMSAAYATRTGAELAALLRDLPAAPAQARGRPIRFALAVFGSSTRQGRFRVGRRMFCIVNAGTVDLDLRQATFEHDVTTVVVVANLGSANVYVPEGVEVDLRGVVVLGHRNLRGADSLPPPGAPLVRVVVIGNLAGIDVFRVPAAWARKTWREVLRGRRELER
jgi:hypothetical protein